MPCLAIPSSAPSVPASASTRRVKAMQALSTIFTSPLDSSCVRLGMMSATRGKVSGGRLRHMFAAVAAAVRWVLMSKKSMKVRAAASPLARTNGSGCSTDSFCIAMRDCSATSMNSMVRRRWQNIVTAPELATLGADLGMTSRRCVMARQLKSIISGLCSIDSSSTSTGRKASTLKPMRISSCPIDSTSQSSVSASICFPSSPCSFSPASSSFIFALPWACGRKSSMPLPSRRRSDWRALLLEASRDCASSASPDPAAPDI
mmetsp:Transcript_61271/g.126571  ORF Transcript_61271/g.126571 Transcript_61271/m.126571 type:complete len:261 (+) Transcript_61271:433-1215(+)